MRKALFRKDLWKDVGPKKKKHEEEEEESEEEEKPPEKPKLHQHHYPYNRRMRAIGLLQIITGTFFYFVSIFLPVFGARGYFTEYLIPMGCATGPAAVLTGIFCRETCRNRRRWAAVVYVVLCSINIILTFVNFIGACAAFKHEDTGWKEDLITERMIANFRYISYIILLILSCALMSFAGLSIFLDLRMLIPSLKVYCDRDWMLEKGAYLAGEQPPPVTTV